MAVEEHGSGLSGLWDTFGGGVIVQLPWECAHRIIWRLYDGGWKPEEGAEAVGAYFVGLRAGGSIPPDIQKCLKGGGAGKPHVWSRDLGNDPQDWEDPGWVPPQGGPSAGEDAAEEGHGVKVGLPTAVQGNEGSVVVEGVDVNPPHPDYRLPIYRHLANTGALSGDGATYRSASGNEVVGAGRP